MVIRKQKTNDVLDTVYEASQIEKVTVKTTVSDNDTTKKTDLYEKYRNMNILEINFNNLKNINSDTVGWIKVNGTKINYPFVNPATMIFI